MKNILSARYAALMMEASLERDRIIDDCVVSAEAAVRPYNKIAASLCDNHRYGTRGTQLYIRITCDGEKHVTYLGIAQDADLSWLRLAIPYLSNSDETTLQVINDELYALNHLLIGQMPPAASITPSN